MDFPDLLKRETDNVTKVMAALSYFGMLALVPTIINRRDPYVSFHARQGLVLWIWEVLAVFSLAVPAIGRLFFQMSGVICFVLSVVGLISVMLGRAWKLPIVGGWAEKL